MNERKLMLCFLIPFTIMVGCRNPSGSGTYTLSYSANGADSGSVPVSGSYVEGENVALAGNTGSLVKSGSPLFTGWNTASDGSGDFYRTGSGFEMPGSDTTLYACYASPADILPSDGEAYDHFGYSVSVSGDYAVFGAPQHNNSAGAVYVFHRTGTNTWDSGIKLTASDPVAYDRFGQSVSINGNFLAVGAPAKKDDSSSKTNYGKVYVFRRTGNSWSQSWSKSPTTLTTGDKFGTSVAISGNCLAVGTLAADTVFRYFYNETNQWDNASSMIRPSDISDGDSFGYALAMTSEFLIVGAYNAQGAVSGSGAAYIYTLGIDGVVVQAAKVSASDGKNGDLFGVSVDLQGDCAIIGASFADINGKTDQGAAYIFKYSSDNSWGSETKLTAGKAGENFGNSVSIYGDTAAIGASKCNDSKGAVYLYTNGNNGWNSSTVLTDPDGSSGDQYHKVALSGDHLIVAAEVDSVGSILNQGSGQIFKY